MGPVRRGAAGLTGARRGTVSRRGRQETASLQGALFNFAFYGVLFAMSLLLQQGRGLSAVTSGLLFLPLTG